MTDEGKETADYEVTVRIRLTFVKQYRQGVVLSPAGIVFMAPMEE